MSHTDACVEARNGAWPDMYKLSLEDQRAVLDCPDETHDAVRMLYSGKPWLAPWLVVVDD